MYKCNEQRDISEFQKFAIWKNRKRGYTIRKVGTIDITSREALILWEALGQFLGKPDYQKEMMEEKEKFIRVYKKPKFIKTK